MLNDTSVFPVALLENAVTRPIAYQRQIETTPEPLQGSVLMENEYDAKTRQNVTYSIVHTWRFLSVLNRNGNPAEVSTGSKIRQLGK